MNHPLIAPENLSVAKAFASPITLAEAYSGGQWQRARHLEVIDYEFRSLLTSETDILIVKVPVRHGKSEYLSRWAQVWYKLRFPCHRQMICTNTAKLARTHSRWVRDKVHELAPLVGLAGVDPANSSATEWNLSGRGMGGCISAGVGGSIVGYGANLLVIDDYMKDAKAAYSQNVRDDQWEWFLSTSSTRLEPGGKIVLLCTQWHSDDLIGRIMKNREELGFIVRCITMQALREENGTKDPLRRQEGEALWPERWSAEVMERRKKKSAKWWASIYQGKPGHDGTNEWPEEYFMNLWCDEDEWPELPNLSACFLDPSKGKNARKGDYSAIVYAGFHEAKVYIDSSIDRRPVPKTCRDMAEFCKERRPLVTGIEGNAFQELMGEDYMQACEDIGYNADPPNLDFNSVSKYLRISRLGTWLSSHSLRFRRTTSNEMLIQQMKDFPNGQHDDGPDALEGVLRLLCESCAALNGLHEPTETTEW